MLTARINLTDTTQDELLLSALIEESNSYSVTINGKPQILDVKIPDNPPASQNLKMGKVSFIDVDRRLNNKIYDVNITPQSIVNQGKNMRINIFMENSNTLAIVIATVDNPYVVETENEEGKRNRYKIKH